MSNVECPFIDTCIYQPGGYFFRAQAKGIKVDARLVEPNRETLKKNTKLRKCPHKVEVCELLGIEVGDIRAVDPNAKLI